MTLFNPFFFLTSENETALVMGGVMLMGLSLLSQPAQAINITYNFDIIGSGFLESFDQTAGGVTATFSNINSGGNTFYADNHGIFVGQAGGYGSQFNISFNQAVKFISYSVSSSFIDPGATATFSLSNPNGSSSSGNNLAGGSFSSNFSNQFSVDANSLSTLTASFTGEPVNSNFSQIQSITVATAVPWETDALPVIGSTILFAGGLWARNKFAKPLQK